MKEVTLAQLISTLETANYLMKIAELADSKAQLNLREAISTAMTRAVHQFRFKRRSLHEIPDPVSRFLARPAQEAYQDLLLKLRNFFEKYYEKSLVSREKGPVLEVLSDGKKTKAILAVMQDGSFFEINLTTHLIGALPAKTSH